jgi:glutamine amidotransferase
MIAILDYDAGNLTSVATAVRYLGREPVITRDPEVVQSAERIIFPGVGAARASMESLQALGLGQALADAKRSGKPILGICIGCQVVFSRSEEDGGTACLDLLEGEVERFRFPNGVRRKVPHMGWNEVRFLREHPVFRGIPPGCHFYFVHSFFPRPRHAADVVGTAVYGEVEFPAAIARDSLVAVQFHAEKSGTAGLKVLDNFLSWQP